jgi:hypothetical protein
MMGPQLKQMYCHLRHWVQRQADSARHCRSCENPVGLLEPTCPNCGAADAARVPVAASVTLVMLPPMALMTYVGCLWWFC